ncbi:methyltransferase [Aliidiomarina halalkaliphila]|uniref:Methyltransferase n=1 Tax=Aliidiomarina halalkaliphila TaxID=2593535 RepID=A0A552X213_9GAMM|nr:methyltransferase [Aliidiomarina halalkaliphila]TRW48986.1 methyltransferase [Aliidiomarina halalkaliphila]
MSPSAFDSENLEATLLAYGRVLMRYRNLWDITPFLAVGWESGIPELENTMASLTEGDIAHFERNPEALYQAIAGFFPELSELPTPQLSASTGADIPFWLHTGIGGRKLTQIQRFVAALPNRPVAKTGSTHQQESVLEWCSGKGYLGRIVAFSRKASVVSVELADSHCIQGAAAAAKFALPQEFIRANVLTESERIPFADVHRAVALHACGGLHTTLMTTSIACQLEALHIAPCCYHLHGEGEYQPMSRYAQTHDLGLSRDALKFCVQGLVTGGDRIARLREQELIWRLAYEAWRQSVTGDASYRSLPSAPKSVFQGEFHVFAVWAAKKHHLSVPDCIQWSPFLIEGQARALAVRRIELMRHVFRRVLELWLVLDRALYLHEHGYHVRVEEFCDYQVTPRNLMIHAQRKN